MKNPFRRIAGYAAVAAATVAALPAGADSTWELVSLMPFPINGGQTSSWQEHSLESLYQIGDGFAAEGHEAEQPVATEPEAVALSPGGTVKLYTNETLRLSVRFEPDGTESELTWRSSRKKVAKVSGDGVLKDETLIPEEL